MSVKPTLLRDIKRSAAQQHQANIGTGTYNRFSALSPRGRTFSTGKRQLEQQGEPEFSFRKAPKLDTNLVFSQLKENDAILEEVDTAISEMEKSNTENPDPRLTVVIKVLKLLGKSQKNLTSAVTDSCKIAPPVSTPKPATALAPAPAKKPENPPLSEEELKQKKVKQVLREAEKKTVLFNLDLGKNPAMNKKTLSRKVTEALGTSLKSGNHDYHIGDAEEVLDDILSCSKLEFLGTQSKLFFNDKNSEDPRNNNMYTLPVRMEFADRERRFEAEVMLRKLCKVSCNVPYPKKLRTQLLDLVKQGKAKQPNCFIRTRVNVEKLTVEAHAKTANGWVDLGLQRPIPLDILDTNVMATSASQVTMDVSSQIS
jgi:hypothetical protein